MKEITITTYRKVAVTLWAVVSVVAGITISSVFDLSRKQAVFAVVAAVGVYALLIVRVYRNTGVRAEKDNTKHVDSYYSEEEVKSNEGVQSDNAEHSQPASHEINEPKIKRTQESEKEMTNKETQEWLDKFLVKQQEGEIK